MMAAAWPRSSVNEMPEKMERGPRGVGYSLARFETSSMRARCCDHTVHLEGLLGHAGRAVVLAHAGDAQAAEPLHQSRVFPQPVDALCEAGGIVRLDQDR